MAKTATAAASPASRRTWTSTCGMARRCAADHTHDYQITEHVALTCTDFGRNVYTCSGCGASVTQPLRPLGGEHVWDGGTVVKQASCAGDGVLRCTCTRCGTTRTEAIPAPPCSSKNLTDVPAPDNWAHPGTRLLRAQRPDVRRRRRPLCPEGHDHTRAGRTDPPNLAGGPKTTGTTPFTDLTQDWYKDAVLWAYQAGASWPGRVRQPSHPRPR